MRSEKKSLILGVIIGLILAFFYFHYFAPRYQINKTGLSTIKIDKWTGRSWRLVGDNWTRMLDRDEEWEQIDKTLQEALKIPFVQVDQDSALEELREKYPLLNKISDDELLERIKLVYSKLVLVNMYLGDFLKTSAVESENGSQEPEVSNQESEKRKE
jgi:hypothetical protein